jgi:hypothetical protein
MEITIRNKEFLKTLDTIAEDMLNTEGYNDPKYYAYSSKEDMTKGEYYCSDEYLDECLRRDRPYGVPDKHFAQPIATMVRKDKAKWSDYMQRVKYDFAAEIGAHTSALLSYYPPGGFVGWHTNWDASAYQVLFTWSKTGDGYFRYYDLETKEIITIQDKPGWQARWYHFGPLEEPHNICWHAAYAGCERITLAYKFCGYGEGTETDIQAQRLRDMLIEEIESDD